MPTEELFYIDGPAGVIEASLTVDDPQCKEVGIVCHPHPLYGGNRHDPVVASIKSALLQRGIACLCFNFRGVGSSEGIHDDGVGETEDVLFLLNWLRREKTFNVFYLGGYSFGAMVSLNAAVQCDQSLERLLMVAPPIGMGSTPPASSVSCPVTVLAGDFDDIVSISSINTWIENGTDQCKLIELSGADHFFADFQDKICEMLLSELEQ